MNNYYKDIVSMLFETNAVRVCPENKPFWYTSGTIGPYYINTHFLYGNEKKANDLLAFIDSEKNEKLDFTDKMVDVLMKNYREDRIFKQIVDNICLATKDNVDINNIDYISGGERRDWFFSIIVANLLDKPHLTIFKDLSIVEVNKDMVNEKVDLTGKNVLHIADLITEASSYERAWIPAIENLGGKIFCSIVVVDRKQGGAELLASKGIKLISLVSVEKDLFINAMGMGYINNEQNRMLSNYIDDPKGAMKGFLEENPEFINNALNSDAKTRERAQLCIEKNIY